MIMNFLLAFILFNLISVSFENEVIGCGGFIKSNTEINYKIIKVKLLTKEGFVKYTTESSPINGYYMIPIYAKGEYILQVNPPPGWSFEPTEFNVNVDGVNDVCSKNEDINFYFKGFGLSGKVVTYGDHKNNGPSGINLNLISNGRTIDTTLSGANGYYYFSNVMPGDYQVEAHHSNIKFLKNQVDVSLSKENWSAKDNILVSGYKIEGHVISGNKIPIKDVVIELFFDDKIYSNIDTKNFGCEFFVKQQHDSICYLKTNTEGKFTFSNIAFGKYKIKASLEKENLKIGMKPDYFHVDLTKHQDVLISESFKLDKVSIKSQILLGIEDKGFNDVQIYENNKLLSTEIDENGNFLLTDIKSGHHMYEIKSKNVYFEPKVMDIDLDNLYFVNENLQYQKLLSLTKFIANSFDVCGRVKLFKDQNFLDLYKLINIKSYYYKDDNLMLFKSVNLDKNFQYCMPLIPKHDYIIKAELTDLNLAKILKLIPIEKKIKLNNSPILNIDFEQLESKLEGEMVILFNPKQIPKSLTITLKAEDLNRSWKKELDATCETIHQNQNPFIVCKFIFTNLLFGNYYLTTNYDELYCWNIIHQPILININSETQNIVIKQIGFIIDYQFDHTNILLKIAEQDQFEKNILKVTDLSGKFCLPEAKDYTLIISSCHKYSSSPNDIEKIKINSDLFQIGSNKLLFKTTYVQVDIQIIFKFDNINQKELVDAKDLLVDLYNYDNKIESINLRISAESENEIVFFARTWLPPNQLIRFRATSNKVLFDQNDKELKIDSNICSLNQIKFEAKLGIFISIAINSNNILLNDIDIVLSSNKDNSIIQKLKSNGENKYILGPLKAPHSLYNVELSKVGYIFKKNISDKFNNNIINIEFIAEKLGKLIVNVIDKNIETISLENVLLSLTSENRLFRQTLKTDQKGNALFDNLKPGLYFLIVMMQEYEFTPNSYPIQITDGYEMSLSIKANRIAFSCFGKVTSINGKYENNIEVEANGLNSIVNSDTQNEICSTSQESAKIENGFYHIFNLKPNCEYKLNLKYLNSNMTSKIIPSSYNLIVESSDIKDKDFKIIDINDKVDLTLEISLKSKYLTSLVNGQNNFVKIKLFKMNQPEIILQTQFALINSIIYFKFIPKDEKQQYSIQISLLTASSISFVGFLNQQQQLQLQQLPVIEYLELGFYADSAHKHLIANFDAFSKDKLNNNSDSKKEYQNVYMTLPIFIIIIGIFLNTKKVQNNILFIKNYIQNRGYLKNFQTNSIANQQISNSKSNRMNKTLSKDSSNNPNEIERSSKYSPRQSGHINFSHEENTSQSYKIEKSEIENYEIINSDEIIDLQLNSRKQRVKKVD